MAIATSYNVTSVKGAREKPGKCLENRFSTRDAPVWLLSHNPPLRRLL